MPGGIRKGFFMMSSERMQRVREKRRRRLVVLGVLAGLLLVGYFIGKAWATGQIEERIVQRLKERGLSITWQDSVWTPWRGLLLEGVSVKENHGEMRPVAEVGNVSIHFPLQQLLGKDRVIIWWLKSSKVVLTDAQGTVTLDSVSLRAEARRGEVLITRGTVRQQALVIDVSGKVLTRAQPVKRTDPFVLKLAAVRGTLGALDVESGGPFRVGGTFEVDMRNGAPFPWSTELKGEGENIVWKGIPMEHAVAKGKLGDEATELHVECKGKEADVWLTMKRKEWAKTPFVFDGVLKDKAEREDPFKGTYEKKVMTISHIAGSADLWKVAKSIPIVAEKLPEKLEVRSFPKVTAKDIRVEVGERPVKWSVESVTTDGSGSFAWPYEDEQVVFSKVSGGAAYDGKAWNIEGGKAAVLGGTIEVDGRYGDGKLSGGRIKSEGIRVRDLKLLADKEGGVGDGVIYLDYKGAVDFGAKEFDGSGTARLENAPVFDVPLLEEVYDLFAALIPGMNAMDKGRFDATFTAHDKKVEVTRFKATGGTLNVSAKGTVDLAKKRVDGRARGKLTGLPGLITKPLSRLLELEVSGPFDDVRVKPMGPAILASSEAPEDVGEAFEAIEESGKAAGEIIKEGVKAPFRFLREKTKAAEEKAGGDGADGGEKKNQALPRGGR